MVIWIVAVEPRLGTADGGEPVHAYLRGGSVTQYSVEEGPHAYVRRATCPVAGDDSCRLDRGRTGFRLPDEVFYPIRIKELGKHCWMVWPADFLHDPNSVPHLPRRTPLPMFDLRRRELEEFSPSSISPSALATADRGLEPSLRPWKAIYASDAPIAAMLLSRLCDLEDDEMGQYHPTYPVSWQSPEFADWAKKEQGAFARFGSYDLLADADGGCRLFLVAEGSKNRRHILPPSLERRMYELTTIPAKPPANTWTWRVVDHYPSDFVNRFYVVDSNGGRWFVTGDGELHRLSGQGVDKAVRKVLLRASEPIRVLLEEPGAVARCFAFTSKSWFEIKEPIEHHDFALPALKPKEPMPTLLECAREVRKLHPAAKKEDPVAPPKQKKLD